MKEYKYWLMMAAIFATAAVAAHQPTEVILTGVAGLASLTAWWAIITDGIVRSVLTRVFGGDKSEWEEYE